MRLTRCAFNFEARCPIVRNMPYCLFTRRGWGRPHSGPVLYVTSRQSGVDRL